MATENRKRLQRDLAEHLREKDRAALGLLRAKIQAARVERRHRLRAARQSCHSALLTLRAQQKEERHQLTLHHRAEREGGRATCHAGKQQAREEGFSLEREARSEYDEERDFQRQMRRATKPRVKRSTIRERKQEDDDSVRNNLPRDLVAVFDKHRRAIKGSARRSRTEEFLQWAEENPDEVIAIQQAEADRALKELLKQERELGRSVRSTTRYKQSPEELSRLLADVPF
ncbi:MAG TPA: hypothetical protein VJN18_01845 [Polyangiaceae bacterium]|nr:hypothetical protein [Polyangiaceae bacterium]